MLHACGSVELPVRVVVHIVVFLREWFISLFVCLFDDFKLKLAVLIKKSMSTNFGDHKIDRNQ